MELLYLMISFIAIVIMIIMRRPLWQAIMAGIFLLIIFFNIPAYKCFFIVSNVVLKWSSLSVLVSLYLVTYLQKLMSSAKMIEMAQKDLNGLFNNRVINTSGAPLVIGLLPSAAAMILCGDIVKSYTDGYLNREEQAFVTSWIRHIPESSLPTYSGVLVMMTFSGISLQKFMPCMIIPVVTLFLLAYIPYLRKLPVDTGYPESENKLADLKNLLYHLWPLIMIIVLLLVFKLSVVLSVLISIIAFAAIEKVPFANLKQLFLKSFEKKLLLNTFFVLTLKEFIEYSGTLQNIPAILSKLPIPPYLIFCLLFFFCGALSGSSASIALGAPLAFSAIPDGGVPLMVVLLCMSHASSQISPAHVCLTIASEYYDISFGSLVKKTLPATIAFCMIMIIYYHVLKFVF